MKGACYKTRNGNREMKRNEIETARVRQLISEHFDFALSQLKGQCVGIVYPCEAV